MNFVTRPPIDANGVGHGPDDLDEALFAFFRSEMPDPWPQLKLPSRVPSAPPVRLPTAVPSPSRRPWFRSPRFALAASVALLIGGYAVMSAALAPPTIDTAKFDEAFQKNLKHDVERPKTTAPADDDDKKIDTSIEIDPFSDDGGTIHIKIKRR